MAKESQGVLGLMLAQWWMESGSEVGDYGIRCLGSNFDLPLVRLIPDMAGCRVQGISKLMLSGTGSQGSWWKGPRCLIAGVVLLLVGRVRSWGG